MMSDELDSMNNSSLLSVDYNYSWTARRLYTELGLSSYKRTKDCLMADGNLLKLLRSA